MKLLEDRAQPRSCRTEIFRQYARVSHRGHEVRIARPPGYEMDVEVILNTGTRRLSKIDSDINPLRPVRLAKRKFAPLGQHTHLDHLLRRERGEAADVPARHDHEVAVVVGIQVEDDVAHASLEDHQGRVFRELGLRAEDTAGVPVGARDVLQPPGGPETVQR